MQGMGRGASGPVTISAVIKARNESHQIVACIDSLRSLCSEIIVVDDQSDDSTAELASAAGARVVPARSHDGYINVLDRVGFDAAEGEWILRLDADERMPASLASRLSQLAQQPGVAGVRFARRNVMFGDWPRHGGWFVADQLRFFRRSAWSRDDTRWELDLHGHPRIEGRVVTLPAEPELATLHLDYDAVPAFAHRSLERYARTEAMLQFHDGQRFSVRRLLVLPVRRFVGRYVVRRGFRDGTRGLVLAILLALYDIMIQLNLWDLERGSTPDPVTPEAADERRRA